jgi:hypothetical protein
MEGYFIYASPDDSKALYPNNSFEDFVVELPETLYLEGEWEMALLDVVYNANVHTTVNCPKGPSLLMFCDICEESFVRGRKLPILRQLEKPATFDPPIFKRVKTFSAKRIRVYMTDYDLEPVAVADWKLKCVFRLRKAI